MNPLRLATCAATPLLGCVMLLGAVMPARAVPLFARQTGQNCIACHVSFPELTPYGRYFKLSGYTLGTRQPVPLALMAQLEYTKMNDNTVDDGPGNIPVEKDGQVAFSGASLFVGGKATDNIGALAQWTYDGIGHHSSIDNTDIRVVGRYEGSGSIEPDLIYGLTLNNNPTAQDVWNDTPAWGYPFTASPTAYTPAPASIIDGGLEQQVTGIGGYAFWKKSLYGELSFYRASTGPFGLLRAGTLDSDTRLKGDFNPYWRFAYNHEWGSNSVEVGTFGLQAKRYALSTDPNSGIGKFTDIAIDAQYQFITDPHVATAQLTWIHEKQAFDDNYVLNIGSANSSDTLRTFRAKGTYYYKRTYGATIAFATTSGTSDTGLYQSPPADAFAPSGSPDWTSWTLELDYLPIQNVRLMLQYIAYTKFNGGSGNYSGAGRNASDNNSLFLNLWVAF